MAERSEPETTEDGRWIVVDGRRWRATDPGIPGPFRTELVAELMSARRAVAAARRAPDPGAEKEARRRVQDAKVALGERGEPWWEDPTEQGRDERLRAAVLALARHRAAADGTICPSDAARAVGGDIWRPLMEPVREVVRELALAGHVQITQKGEVVDPTVPWHGPIRVRSTPPG
jgi:hypothetical protein